jgi:hypothetical protein
MAASTNHTTVSRSRRVFPHTRPAPGAAAFARRLRHRWARRRLRRYRLEQHRTVHEAGHTPAERRALKVPAEAARRAYQKPELQELWQLSVQELQILAEYRQLSRLKKRAFWLAMRHRRLAPLMAWFIRLRVGTRWERG